MARRPANSQVKHGDPACADYGCKREECLEARRRKQKRNKLLRSTGRPGMVDSQRAAAHLAKFRQAGFQDVQILGMVPVARNTFYRVMRGESLSRISEQKILSIPVPKPVGTVRTLATVDATGTHRRLKALMWLGWPCGVLEQRIGVHEAWINRSLRCRSRVTQLVEVRVRALYDECWNLQPERAGVNAGEAEGTRFYARSRSWNGPLAWDEDTIDDPGAAPQTDAPSPVVSEGGNLAARWLLGESVVLGSDDRREVIRHLFEWTQMTVAEIAERVEMTHAATEQTWMRIRKQARLEGRPVPWRRTYPLRNKALSKKDMEEAA